MIYIHIGYQKTNSTWLQKQIFSREGDFNYIGPNSKKDYKAFISYLIYGYGSGDRNENKVDRQKVKKIVTEINNNDKNWLISGEGLIGSLYLNGNDRQNIWNRIDKLSGKKIILITTRSQNSLLISMYRQFILDGGCYDAILFKKMFDESKLIGLDFLNLEKALQFYISKVGVSNVHLLPLETVYIHGHKLYINNLKKAFNLNFTSNYDTKIIRTGLSNSQLLLVRIANRFTKTHLNPISGPSIYNKILGISIWRFIRLLSIILDIFISDKLRKDLNFNNYQTKVLTKSNINIEKYFLDKNLFKKYYLFNKMEGEKN